MLTAVHLDNQLRFEADEIADVAVERDLPAKLQPFELPVAERLPQQVLRLRGVGPHSAGEGAM